MVALDLTNVDFEKLREAAMNLEEAQKALSSAERKAYREAQQSVVDARRKAETNEGLLRVC